MPVEVLLVRVRRRRHLLLESMDLVVPRVRVHWARVGTMVEVQKVRVGTMVDEVPAGTMRQVR